MANLQTDNPYRRIRRQAATLLICLAGLLTVGILHILSDNAHTLMRSHATQTAQNWAKYFSQVTPDIEKMMLTGLPATIAIDKYYEASPINRIERFTVLNAVGRPVYTFRPLISAATGVDHTFVQANPQFINKQLVQQMTGTSANTGTKPLLNASIVPVIKDGIAIGALHVVVDQSHLNTIFLEAAVSGGWEILVLVNLVLLACWFMYLILTRVARQYSELTSRTDQLTGLPSRNAFVMELDDALARNEIGQQKTAVLIVKIDRFRELNDLLGHDGADAILREVANRLQIIAGQGGYAARISGNTFGMVFANMDSASGAADIGDQIIASLAQPFMRRGKRIQPKASIGVSLSPEDGTDTATLLKRADIAQFVAHMHGGNQLNFYDAATAARFAEQHELENLIIKASDEHLFQLHYQPLYSLKTRQLTGFEALIRLPNDDGNMVSPERFIPLAESLRKINEIGAWVLFEACRTARQWPQDITVAVNLSPVQFQSGELIDDVKQALNASGLPPERLELEVTENLMLENTEMVHAQLDQLRQMGIKIALDDFGTGYSSLNYLWQFPFDRIKIDRSFVAGLGQSEQAKGILKTIVDLARTMNLPITAEGIETPEQLEYLAELGCHTGQGYYLGRPQPATQVAATLLADFQTGNPVTGDVQAGAEANNKIALAG